jgi:hypothetical protein
MGISAALRIYAILLSEGAPSHILDVENTRIVTRGSFAGRFSPVSAARLEELTV